MEPGIPVPSRAVVLEKPNIVLFPGLIDVHVHLREPGFSYKETMGTGTLAAARGGFTRVCAMPNLDPVPDDREHLDAQLDRIRAGARVRVSPYGAITRGEKGEALADLEAMAPFVAGFSDDGRGVQSEEMMRAAMLEAKRLGKIIAAHCEDMALVRGGCIHDGAYARAHHLPGICSESEWRQVERDLRLAEETGCKYHVCHVSTKESVALIRAAKARGVDVTCETGPALPDAGRKLPADEGRFKMNPPLRGKGGPRGAAYGSARRHGGHGGHRPRAPLCQRKIARPTREPHGGGGAGNGLPSTIHAPGQNGLDDAGSAARPHARSSRRPLRL